MAATAQHRLQRINILQLETYGVAKRKRDLFFQAPVFSDEDNDMRTKRGSVYSRNVSQFC